MGEAGSLGHMSKEVCHLVLLGDSMVSSRQINKSVECSEASRSIAVKWLPSGDFTG